MLFPALLLAAQLAAAPQDPDPVQKPSVELNLEDALPRLIGLMRAGIDVTDPNNGWFHGAGLESCFDGSYDWHSCVIAHFALLNHARVHADAELARFMLDRLTPRVLKAEQALLEDRGSSGSVTYPYDEAWYLMLLAELARHAGVDQEQIRALREAHEDKLLDFLEASDFPEGVPKVDFCGFYRSWLFAYLLVTLSHPIAPDSPARLARLHREKLQPAREKLTQRRDAHPWDFLWLPAVLALVDRVARPDERSPYEPGLGQPLPDEVNISTVHQLGVSLSRMWPCAYDGGCGDELARERYMQATLALLAREDLWATDFAACSHWVPQYIWLGMWFAEGCP